MKLIIDIPEEAYNLLKTSGADWLGAAHILDAVSKGIPLPKGHGRLIDADKLKPEARYIRPDGVTVYVHAVPIMKVVNAPTIIEADKED